MASYISVSATQIKYKEDLRILRGLGCFLYDTPDMVRSRHLRKLWVSAHLRSTELPWHSSTHPVTSRKVPDRKNLCLQLLLRGNLPLTNLNKL